MLFRSLWTFDQVYAFHFDDDFLHLESSNVTTGFCLRYKGNMNGWLLSLCSIHSRLLDVLMDLSVAQLWNKILVDEFRLKRINWLHSGRTHGKVIERCRFEAKHVGFILKEGLRLYNFYWGSYYDFYVLSNGMSVLLWEFGSLEEDGMTVTRLSMPLGWLFGMCYG